MLGNDKSNLNFFVFVNVKNINLERHLHTGLFFLNGVVSVFYTQKPRFMRFVIKL